MDIRALILKRLKSAGKEWWQLEKGITPEICEAIKAMQSGEMKYADYKKRNRIEGVLPRWLYRGRGYPSSGIMFRFFHQRQTVSLHSLDWIIRLSGMSIEPNDAGIRQTIASQIKRRGLTTYAVAKLLTGTVPRRTVYHFLASQDRSLNVDALGKLLDVLDISLV